MKKMIIIYIFYILFFNSILSKENTINEIKKKIDSQLRKLNFRDNLKDLLNKGGIFNCDNIYCSQISFIKSQYLENQIQKFPQVYPSNIANNNVIIKIFQKHLFAEESKNYISGINGISDIVYVNLYKFENDIINTEPLDIASIKQNILLVYLPLYVKDSLKNKILSVSGQNPNSDIEKLINYDIFNPNSKIYNDICTTITYSILPEDVYNQESVKNLDITLEQRKKYYFPGNLQLCPKNCIYKGIDRKTISSICQCNIEYLNIVEHNEYISFHFDENNFYNSNEDIYFSMNTLKCLSSVNLKNNYGFYIILIIAILILFLFALIFIKRNKYIQDVLDSFNSLNIKYNHENKNDNNENIKYLDNKDTQIKKDDKDNNTDIKKDEQNKVLGVNLKRNKSIISNKKVKKKKSIHNVNHEENQPSNNKILSIIDIDNDNNKVDNMNNFMPSDNKNNNNEEIYNNYIIKSELNKENMNDLNKKAINIKSNLNNIYFTEEEFNNMDFEYSSKYDKRKFIDIYLSFLRIKLPVLFVLFFSFLLKVNHSNVEGNIRMKHKIFKIIIFCWELMIYLFIYSSFFGSKSVSKIYFGDFNSGKKCVLGIIIALFALILKNLVYFFSYDLMNKKIMELKIYFINKLRINNNHKNQKEENDVEFNNIKDKTINYLKIQFLIFFVISVVVLLFDWLLITSFCSVYKNSQIEFFISISICYFFSILFSFVYCLIPSIFRYFSLKDKSCSKTLFIISNLTKII